MYIYVCIYIYICMYIHIYIILITLNMCMCVCVMCVCVLGIIQYLLSVIKIGSISIKSAMIKGHSLVKGTILKPLFCPVFM